MKSRLLLLFVSCSFFAYGQNDTIIYFSNLQKTTFPNNALFYSKLINQKRGDFLLNSYVKQNNIWIVNEESKIHRTTDTSFLISSSNNSFTRSFKKNDSCYFINDFIGSILISSGYSKTLFPLVKVGHWLKYNSFGILNEEDYFIDNQCISNKYYLSDGTTIDDVFIYTDSYPKYEGGDVALLQFIAQNTEYPVLARDRGITGKVIVLFIVTKDAKITGLEVLKGVNPLLDKAAINVVQRIPNKWIPAKIGNENVNSFMMVPINFSIK